MDDADYESEAPLRSSDRIEGSLVGSGMSVWEESGSDERSRMLSKRLVLSVG